MKAAKIDLQEFSKWWHAGETLQAIASRLGVSKATVKRFADKSGLPHRCHENQHQSPKDPTPEEIERLKVELRERHLEERRAETDFASRARDWRRRREIA